MSASFQRPATVWVVDLEQPGADGGDCLAPDERARAARFTFDRDRRRYVAGRSALRAILGTALGCQPSDVPLAATEYGRPTCGALAGRVDFNLSNSQDVAVIALSQNAPVGVDVEVLRPIADALDLCRCFFNDSETRAIEALEGPERDRAFLTCWTRKEAVLKATGLGLSIDPTAVATGTDPVPLMVSIAQGTFAIRTFEVALGVIATLAVPNVVPDIRVQAFTAAAFAQVA